MPIFWGREVELDRFCMAQKFCCLGEYFLNWVGRKVVSFFGEEKVTAGRENPFFITEAEEAKDFMERAPESFFCCLERSFEELHF